MFINATKSDSKGYEPSIVTTRSELNSRIKGV